MVPIIPDEARTFGMESLFRQFGIYASQGQLYKPHDAEMFLYYKESKDGQILEEGITEAGSMASFTAAGTAYANYGVEMIPFFIYYSMFGFQRVGDLIWAFADARGKGFLCGGTAGRTTLAGEGLQHQDGHSIVLASTVPNCATYDPAYAYEIAIIVQDGIRRMYQEQEDRFYYLTLYNENYAMPAMPAGSGSRRRAASGIYRFKAAGEGQGRRCSCSAAVRSSTKRCARSRSWRRSTTSPADVWSVTSYNELRRDALRRGALEPPASRPAGADAVHPAGAEGRRWPDHRGQRLHEGGGRPDCAVAAGPHGNAGHRRLRPQRQPRVPAPALRDQRRIHRRRGALAAGARRQVRRREGRSPPSPNWASTPRRSTPHGHSAGSDLESCRPINANRATRRRHRDAGLAARWPSSRSWPDCPGTPPRWSPTAWNRPRDVIASGFVLFGLTLAAKPADENHPYGHGRVETLTGLLIGLVLTVGGALISWNSIRRVGQPHEPLAAFVVWPLLLSIAAKTGLATLKFRYGRKLQSDALDRRRLERRHRYHLRDSPR